jgi:hypothetical protein
MIWLHAEPPISRAWPRRGAVHPHHSVDRRGFAVGLAGVSPCELTPPSLTAIFVHRTMPYVWLGINHLQWACCLL